MNGGEAHGTCTILLNYWLLINSGRWGAIIHTWVVYPLVHPPGSNPKVKQMNLVKPRGVQTKQKVRDIGMRIVGKRDMARRVGETRGDAVRTITKPYLHRQLSENNWFCHVCMQPWKILSVTCTQHGGLLMIPALWVKLKGHLQPHSEASLA